jgi:N-acetylmuramoyl-L-alanine amidase
MPTRSNLALPTDGSGLIDQIRPGEVNTITVQLAANAGAARLSPQSTDAVPRLVLEVQPATPTATASPPAADSGVPRQNGPAPAAVSVESLTAPRSGTVILDPGHGGDDTGTKSAGTQEKQLTLDIARRVRALLEMHLGVHVMLTGTATLPSRSTPASRSPTTTKAISFSACMRMRHRPRRWKARRSITCSSIAKASGHAPMRHVPQWPSR